MKAKSELIGNNETPQGAIPIYDIHGEEISPEWAAEFRGFFWGEGSLTSVRGPARATPSPIVSIGLRADDQAVLEQFKQRLGGRIRQEPYRDGSGKFISRWVVIRAKDLVRIHLVLSSSPTGLTFNKCRQLRVWGRMVVMKADRVKWTRHIPEERDALRAMHDELHRLKLWGS